MTYHTTPHNNKLKRILSLNLINTQRYSGCSRTNFLYHAEHIYILAVLLLISYFIYHIIYMMYTWIQTKYILLFFFSILIYKKVMLKRFDYHGLDSLPRRVDCRSKPEIYFISIFCHFNVIAHAVETLCHGTQWPVYPLYSQRHHCWWFNIDSDNGLLPDSAEPLPEPQQVPVAFIWGHYLNSLRPSDAYMRRQTNHYWFR